MSYEQISAIGTMGAFIVGAIAICLSVVSAKIDRQRKSMSGVIDFFNNTRFEHNSGTSQNRNIYFGIDAFLQCLNNVTYSENAKTAPHYNLDHFLFSLEALMSEFMFIGKTEKILLGRINTSMLSPLLSTVSVLRADMPPKEEGDYLNDLYGRIQELQRKISEKISVC